MRKLIFAVVALLVSCAPVTTPQSAAPSVASTPLQSGAPIATTTPSETSSSAPSPIASPTATPAPLPQPETGFDVAPTVSVGQAVFPIMTTLRLKLATIDDVVRGDARWGVERYLQSIDSYRNGQSPALPITGPFLAAVSAALKESATPGVQRKFEIESLNVDHHVQKPWGTHAYVEVTVSLVDRAVNGNAPDQRETGKLRLTGDKMFVTDGWDFDNDRWFNGFGPLPLEQVRSGVAEALQSYFWMESWTANTTPPALSWNASSAFQQERATRVKAAHVAGAVSQLFEGVSATIEGFETIDGIWSGIATVRVNGTRVTTNASGQTTRAPFERQVRAFILGNWSPEVVDEQTSTGTWASGGELALDQVDVNRA